MRISNVWHVEVKQSSDEWNKIFRLHASELNNDLTFDAIQHASVLDYFKGKQLRIKALRISESGEPMDFFGHLISNWTISSKEIFVPLQAENFSIEFMEPLNK